MLRTRLRERLWPVALLLLALGGGVAIGVLGASRATAFDWGLFAEGATAIGTVLLAAYTATLAKSTTREVAVSVEDQRARERPTVVAVVEELTTAVLEPLWGIRVPAVNVRLLNVGLGAALAIHLELRYPGSEGVGREVVSVLQIGEGVTRSISVQEIESPPEGLLLEKFVLTGTFEGRVPGLDGEIRVLADEGLRDLQRAAERVAAGKANPYFNVMSAATVTNGSVEYQAQAGNTARGTAYDTEVVFADADGKRWGDVLVFPRLEPNRGENATVRLPGNRPVLSYRITWRDGEGEHEREQEDVLPSHWSEEPA
jgi:hypothetical protein